MKSHNNSSVTDKRILSVNQLDFSFKCYNASLWRFTTVWFEASVTMLQIWRSHQFHSKDTMLWIWSCISICEATVWELHQFIFEEALYPWRVYARFFYFIIYYQRLKNWYASNSHTAFLIKSYNSLTVMLVQSVTTL